MVVACDCCLASKKITSAVAYLLKKSNQSYDNFKIGVYNNHIVM